MPLLFSINIIRLWVRMPIELSHFLFISFFKFYFRKFYIYWFCSYFFLDPNKYAKFCSFLLHVNRRAYISSSLKNYCVIAASFWFKDLYSSSEASKLTFHPLSQGTFLIYFTLLFCDSGRKVGFRTCVTATINYITLKTFLFT